ncbi:hypothetical protein TGDOM2_398720 [Toxoplasma gondii GAB2-2007-GAL-DOM2]|uniref:Uncharacterized protein n=1 Tax=Toxoplasma gondii GAB2-2007-GAL-DOM2 TaxID=1130820 RepID=A0A086KF72_TOXGO|nr:hypothetical protein TGDOM2_398720 [Toxoplasma gondii GAB2-2007-GAL-DOM2]
MLGNIEAVHIDGWKRRPTGDLRSSETTQRETLERGRLPFAHSIFDARPEKNKNSLQTFSSHAEPSEAVEERSLA